MCDRVCTSIRNCFSQIYKIIVQFTMLFKKTPKVAPEGSSQSGRRTRRTLRGSGSFEIIYSKDESISGSINTKPFMILRLPKNLRLKLYDMLDYRSVFALSLTNRRIRKDIGQIKGFKIHLGIDSPADFSITDGVESLHINSYPHQLPSLPYPDLLKELTISGKIMDSRNVNDFLRVTPQLQVLRLDHIVLKSSRSKFLENIICPKLRQLHVNVVKVFPSLFNFVYANHLSLNELQIRIWSTSNRTSDPKTTILERKTTNIFPNLKHLSLTLDRPFDEFKLLLSAQHNLKYFTMIANESLPWNEIGLYVLENCSESLQNLTVVNLRAQMGSLVWPVDLSLLRHCTALRSLSLAHQPQDEFVARVSHSDSLPQNIRHLSLAHFTLRTHQETTLLLKYPQLSSLELCYHSESEGNLAHFLSSLNFLYQMGLCSVSNIRVQDLRSVVDSVDKEIRSMEVNHCVTVIHSGQDDGGESIVTITPNSACRE